MDRHICGACHAEINDLDEFIIHKRLTCPNLLKNPESNLKPQPVITSSPGSVDIPSYTTGQHETSKDLHAKNTGKVGEKEDSGITNIKIQKPHSHSETPNDIAQNIISHSVDCTKPSNESCFMSDRVVSHEISKSSDIEKGTKLTDDSLIKNLVIPTITMSPVTDKDSQFNQSNVYCFDSETTTVVCTPPDGHDYIQTSVRNSDPNNGVHTFVTSDNVKSDNTSSAVENSNRDDLSAVVTRSLQMVLDHNGSYSLLSKFQIPMSLHTEKANNESLQPFFHQSSETSQEIIPNDPSKSRDLQTVPTNNPAQETLQQNTIHVVLQRHKDEQSKSIQPNDDSSSDSLSDHTSVNLTENRESHLGPAKNVAEGKVSDKHKYKESKNIPNESDNSKIIEDLHRGKLKCYTSKNSSKEDSSKAISLLKPNDMDRILKVYSDSKHGINSLTTEPDPTRQHGKGHDFILLPSYIEFNDNVSSGVLSPTPHNVVQTDTVNGTHQATYSSSLPCTQSSQNSVITTFPCVPTVQPTSTVTPRGIMNENLIENQPKTLGLISAEKRGQTSVVLEWQRTPEGQQDERHSSTGIQYVLHKTPERNYFLPINKGASEDDTTPPGPQSLEEQASPDKINSRVTSPGQTEYTVHVQSIDSRGVLDGQIIQVINTPEKYPSISTKKKGSNTGLCRKSSATTSKEREKKYACGHDNCSYSTVYYKDLKRHQRTHTGEKPYTCGMCDKTFSRLDKLRLHIRAHTGEKPYQCNVCDYRAVDSSALKKHEIIHTDERPYTCQLCSYSCRTSSQLTVHLRTHTGDCPFTCPKCKKKFKIKSDLKRHYLTHTGEKPWHCTECEMRFTTQGNLAQHVKIHHSPDKQSKCSHCDFKTSSKRAMWDHIKSHEPENQDTTCQICNFKCTTQDVLRRHMVVHRYIVCSHCDFMTRHTHSLEEHIKRKHSEHYHQNYKSNNKISGKNESSSHTKTTIYRESESRKDSKGRKSSYRKFQRTHRCDKCDESFVRKDSLDSHRRLHDELDRDLHHLSSAGVVLRLKNPTSSVVLESNQQYSTVLNRFDDSQPNQYQELNTEDHVRNRGVSGGYYRNESVQTSDNTQVLENHRRQLDFDTVQDNDSLSSVNRQLLETSSSSRLSLDVSQSTQYSLESFSSHRKDTHHRRHTVHGDSEHSSSKRSKVFSDLKTYSNRPVRELLKAERQLQSSSLRDKRQQNIEKKKIPDRHSYPSIPTGNQDTSHDRKLHGKSMRKNSKFYVVGSNEPTENSISIPTLERGSATLPLMETVNDPRTVTLSHHQQSVYQLPNIQLVQSISLPLGNQIIREVNVEQPSLINTEMVHPVNDSVRTIQLRAPPNVELLQNSSSQVAQNISMPQVVKILEQSGNAVPTQFVIPSSCQEDGQSVAIQTLDMTAVQDHASLEQGIMMSPTHVVTVPIQVLDIPTNAVE